MSFLDILGSILQTSIFLIHSMVEVHAESEENFRLDVFICVCSRYVFQSDGRFIQSSSKLESTTGYWVCLCLCVCVQFGI